MSCITHKTPSPVPVNTEESIWGCYSAVPKNMKGSQYVWTFCFFCHIFLNIDFEPALTDPSSYQTTKSRNSWGWKVPLEVIWSTPPAQAVLSRASHPGPRSGGFWTDGNSTDSLGNLCLCSVTLTVKSVSWCSNTSPVFHFVPTAIGPVTGHQWKEPGSISLHLLSRYLCMLIRSSPSLFCSRLNNPSSLSLSSWDRCSSPFITSVAHRWTLSSMSMSLLCWGAQNRTQHSRCNLTSAEQKGRLTSLLLLAIFPLVQPRCCWLFCCKGTLLAHVQLGVHQDPQVPLLQSCFPYTYFVWKEFLLVKN